MEKIRWERLAAILFCLGAGATLLFLGFRYIFPVFVPFLIAWAVSLLIRPMAERISRQFHISAKLCAVVLLSFFLGGSIFLIYSSFARLIAELQHLLERLLSENGGFSDAIQHSADFFDTVTSRVGFLRRIGAGERFSAFREYFNEMIADMFGSFLNSLSAALPAFIGRVFSALPGILFVTIVTVIAGFYFCIDGGKITSGLRRLLPAFILRRLPAWQVRLKHFSWRYLKVYLLLLLLTFTELFLGFSILRVDYAFLLALLVALVDMLPVLGVGSVLVPWAVVLLLQKNYYMGFGLLILYFATLVLRQIIEPKLVGRSLGLHPLLTLFASYAGWQLFGLFGMLAGPILALACKGVISQFREPVGTS